MIFRVSVFTVLLQLPDNGSILRSKLFARITFTSWLLCVIGNGININLRNKSSFVFHVIYYCVKVSWDLRCAAQNLSYVRLSAWLFRSLVVRVIVSFGTRNILPQTAELLNRSYLKDCGICLPQRGVSLPIDFSLCVLVPPTPALKCWWHTTGRCLPAHLSSLPLSGLHSSPHS